MKIQIEKCLKTEFQIPDAEPGTRRIYIMPYVGNMTKGKIDLVARSLRSELLKDGWFDAGEAMVVELARRLESSWYTGKERQVAVELNTAGRIDIRGQGWMCANYPPDQVRVMACA